jgi:Flp pilus assembly pilin Flp
MRLARRLLAAIRSTGSELLRRKQAAQDVVEYGIIVATIALVVLLGTTAFGSQIRPWFESLAGRIITNGT